MTGSASADRELAALLAASGVERPVEEVRALVAGVAAAPPGFFPDAWLDLVAPPEANELRDHLRASRRRSRHSVRPSRRLPSGSPRCAACWPSAASRASCCR